MMFALLFGLSMDYEVFLLIDPGPLEGPATPAPVIDGLPAPAG